MVLEDCARTWTPALIAAMVAPLTPTQSGEPVPEETTLGELQQGDSDLKEIISYLEDGELPLDD